MLAGLICTTKEARKLEEGLGRVVRASEGEETSLSDLADEICMQTAQALGCLEVSLYVSLGSSREGGRLCRVLNSHPSPEDEQAAIR